MKPSCVDPIQFEEHITGDEPVFSPVDYPEVKLFGTKSRQQHLEEYQVHSRVLAPDDEFLEMHYFTVYQKVISQEAYDYWERIEIVASQSGDLFDQPPVTVEGNIFEKENPENFVLGYFEVSGKSIGWVCILLCLIGGGYITETCPELRNFIIEDKCCFCQLLDEPANRIERPNYWAD
jgi:hypothetical protein